MATYFQIEEPVNPTTVSTPSRRAARAVIFISSAARWRTPSGSPSPQMRSGRMPRCRSSIGSSQTAWPLRWLEIAQTPQAVLREHLLLVREVVVVLDRLPDIEVVTPAGDLEAVVPPAGGESADLLEGQVGPLAGEQRDGSGHVGPSAQVHCCTDEVSCGCAGSPADCQDPSSELRSTAARTHCTCRPSANDGSGCSARADRGHEVGHLVDEPVLVAESVTGRPPVPGIGVFGLGDQDPAEPGGLGGFLARRRTPARSCPRSRRPDFPSSR